MWGVSRSPELVGFLQIQYLGRGLGNLIFCLFMSKKCYDPDMLGSVYNGDSKIPYFGGVSKIFGNLLPTLSNETAAVYF